MKKNIKFYILLLTIFTALHAGIYEYEYHFSEPVMKQYRDHMLVELSGCMQVGIPGEPQLPYYPVMIALPPGETVKSVDIIAQNHTLYPVMLPLMPKQADRPLSWGVSGQGFFKNEAVYKLQQYPSAPARSDVHWFRGVGVLIGNITPVDYFPQAGTIELAEIVTLRIETTVRSGIQQPGDQRLDIIAKNVQNPAMLSSYSTVTGNAAERLLIITSDEFAPAFDTLINFYTQYGISSRLISIENIDAPGRDIQEKIRNTILDIYLQEGLDYVLLGGNSNVVPYRGFSCIVNSGGDLVTSDDIPADLYYAALDGDWDTDGDNIFGEYNDSIGYDEADLLPELAIGRMPAANIEEINNLIAKSMLYQAQPVVEDMDKHLFLGEFLYKDPWSLASDYLELLIGVHDDNGYTTQGLPGYIRTYKWYDTSDTNSVWNFTTIKQELAAGRAFVHHDGHADYTRLMKFSTDQIADSDFVSVNGIDHVNPIIYTHGCNCGGFDYPNSIGSRLVNSPVLAVGGVFNSRYGWFNEGSTEGPSIHLHREFISAIYGLHYYQFGWAHTLSRIATAPWVIADGQHEQNALRWTFYTANILGDPVMRIFSETPQEVQVNYNTTNLHDAILTASISQESDPIVGAGLSVHDQDGNILGFGISNSTGYVEISLSDSCALGDSVYCYVSGENIIPAQDTITAEQTSVSFPEDFTLLNIYPNPFNPETTIRYVLTASDEVTMTIYDIRGRAVRTLFKGFQEAGEHSIIFHASDLPSGVYVCRLQSGNTRTARKIILLK